MLMLLSYSRYEMKPAGPVSFAEVTGLKDTP
jgi:hypothetical protein